MIRHIAFVVATIFAATILTISCRESRDAAQLTPGGQAYLAQCSVCHGVHGAGDGPLAASIVAEGKNPPAAFDAAMVARLGRSGIRTAIETGAHAHPGSPMPIWGSHLGAEWIDRIADYVVAMPAAAESGRQGVERYLASPAGSPPTGRQIYVTYCSACHGPQGAGDGFYSTAVASKLKPAHIGGAALAEFDDQKLARFISIGGGHAPDAMTMPGWLYTISPDDRQALVGYVRALTGAARRQ